MTRQLAREPLRGPHLLKKGTKIWPAFAKKMEVQALGPRMVHRILKYDNEPPNPRRRWTRNETCAPRESDSGMTTSKAAMSPRAFSTMSG